MNNDLFLTSLAMDSRDRGYNRGVKFDKNETSDPISNHDDVKRPSGSPEFWSVRHEIGQ